MVFLRRIAITCQEKSLISLSYIRLKLAVGHLFRLPGVLPRSAEKMSAYDLNENHSIDYI